MTVAELARETGVQDRTIFNILSGSTKAARFKTRKRILDALARLNISPERSAELFRQG